MPVTVRVPAYRTGVVVPCATANVFVVRPAPGIQEFRTLKDGGIEIMQAPDGRSIPYDMIRTTGDLGKTWKSFDGKPGEPLAALRLAP